MALAKSKTVPVPVRLNTELRARLRRAARRMGSTDSATIRFAILNQLPQIEAGHITLS